MPSNAVIYALVDPDTNRVCYIGKTIHPNKRLYQHMKTVLRSPVNLWCRQLKSQFKQPSLVILESVSVEKAAEAEIEWITFGRKINWPLLNVSVGGEGCALSMYSNSFNAAELAATDNADLAGAPIVVANSAAVSVPAAGEEKL